MADLAILALTLALPIFDNANKSERKQGNAGEGLKKNKKRAI